jgi:hypothetical protein
VTLVLFKRMTICAQFQHTNWGSKLNIGCGMWCHIIRCYLMFWKEHVAVIVKASCSMLKFRNDLPSDATSHLRRLKSSDTPIWKHKKLHWFSLLGYTLALSGEILNNSKVSMTRSLQQGNSLFFTNYAISFPLFTRYCLWV